MQLKFIVVSTFLATAVFGAFTIPHDHENGAFTVNFDSQGVANVTKVGELPGVTPRDLTRGSAPSRAMRVTRGGDSHGCSTNKFNDDGNQEAYKQATGCMKSYFAQGSLVASDKIYFCNNGGVFLALCNYGSSQGGYPYEVDNYNNFMDQNCGAWTGGWYFFSGPDKTLWRDTAGTSICNNM